MFGAFFLLFGLFYSVISSNGKFYNQVQVDAVSWSSGQPSIVNGKRSEFNYETLN